MFGKKKVHCPECDSKISEDYDFCPYCGIDLRNPEQEMEDYGILGKNELANGAPMIGGGAMGFTDKIIQSLMNSLVKTIEKQMKNANADGEPEIQALPNGFKIQVGAPKQAKKQKQKSVSQEQIDKMSGLPRVEGKTDVRRLGDKVVYEIKAPGIESVDDVFVSRVESGYEVKAIGKKKVYVNSLPVDLPLRSYTVTEAGLTVEFGA